MEFEIFILFCVIEICFLILLHFNEHSKYNSLFLLLSLPLIYIFRKILLFYNLEEDVLWGILFACKIILFANFVLLLFNLRKYNIKKNKF